MTFYTERKVMTFRQKRSDTKMGTVEKKYERDFGTRSDQKLGNYLKEQGYTSLSELLSNTPKRDPKEKNDRG